MFTPICLYHKQLLHTLFYLNIYINILPSRKTNSVKIRNLVIINSSRKVTDS